MIVCAPRMIEYGTYVIMYGPSMTVYASYVIIYGPTQAKFDTRTGHDSSS